eukprot:4980813-Alexandrium_andersonii.AAC.1
MSASLVGSEMCIRDSSEDPPRTAVGKTGCKYGCVLRPAQRGRGPCCRQLAGAVCEGEVLRKGQHPNEVVRKQHVHPPKLAAVEAKELL